MASIKRTIRAAGHGQFFAGTRGVEDHLWVSLSESQPKNSTLVTDLEVQWPLSLSQEPVEARKRKSRTFLSTSPKTENGQDADPRAKAGGLEVSRNFRCYRHAIPARKAISCYSLAAGRPFVASRLISPCPRLKAFAGERSGSLLLGDEKLIVRDGRWCQTAGVSH
jgi:hypothetical protein